MVGRRRFPRSPNSAPNGARRPRRKSHAFFYAKQTFTVVFRVINCALCAVDPPIGGKEGVCSNAAAFHFPKSTDEKQKTRDQKKEPVGPLEKDLQKKKNQDGRKN